MKSRVRRHALCLLAVPMLVGCHPAPASDQPSKDVAAPNALNGTAEVAAVNAAAPLAPQRGAVGCPATLAGGASAAAGQRLMGKAAGTLPLSNALVTMDAVNDVPDGLSEMTEITAENDPDDNTDRGIWVAEMSASPTAATPVTLICQYGAIPVGQRVSEAMLLLPLPVGKDYVCTVKTPQGKDPRRATAECTLM